MNYGVGCRCGSELALLQLWHGPAAAAPIQPLACGPPYAVGVALKSKKPKNNKKVEEYEEPLEERTLFFCFFMATPTAYGGSQARGQIGTVVTGLHHSHSTATVTPYPSCVCDLHHS